VRHLVQYGGLEQPRAFDHREVLGVESHHAQDRKGARGPHVAGTRLGQGPSGSVHGPEVDEDHDVVDLALDGGRVGAAGPGGGVELDVGELARDESLPALLRGRECRKLGEGGLRPEAQLDRERREPVGAEACRERRIRSIQEKGTQKVEDDIKDEFVGIINYCLIAMIQMKLTVSDETEMDFKVLEPLYDKAVIETFDLLQNKNHDYNEAWRDMRVSSMTDIILMKFLQPENRCYCTIPMLSNQRIGYSSIEKREIDWAAYQSQSFATYTKGL